MRGDDELTLTADPALFLNARTLVRFGLPPFQIEIMTSIDGVEFNPCQREAA